MKFGLFLPRVTRKLLQGASFAGLAFIVACSPENQHEQPEDTQSTPSTFAAVSSDERKASEQSMETNSNDEVDARLSNADGAWRLAWQTDESLCAGIIGALNESNADDGAKPRASESYAATQAREVLATPFNVKWVEAGEDQQAATLDYFNDGVMRSIERRQGKLAGHQTISLWIDDGDGNYAYLDFGHAGVNTKDLPPSDDRHTKLTYSVADVIDLDGRYFTLISPLKDVDKSGEVYAASWSPKNGVQPPLIASDFYPIIECIAAPAADSQ